MKIAFFDAKAYDRPSFDEQGERYGITFKYFETGMNLSSSFVSFWNFCCQGS